MKSIRLIKFGILVLLLPFVFLFISCNNSDNTLDDTIVTDEEFKHATDFKTLRNYEITIISNSEYYTNEIYTITRYNNKFNYFDKTETLTINNYYDINGSEGYDWYYVSGGKYVKLHYETDIFEENVDELAILINLLFSSASEEPHTYNEELKCYNVEFVNKTYILDWCTASGIASFYFKNKMLYKISLEGNLSESPMKSDSKFTMEGIITYNIPDFDLPQVN